MIGERALRFVDAHDHNLMRRMNRWKPPRWFRRWMLTATRAGDGWLWYTAGIVVLVFGGPERYAAVCAAGVAAICGVCLFVVLKRAARRPRPCAIEQSSWVTLLPPDQFSFPSGHSITAFACAVPLSLFYPAAAVLLMFCAISVAISRIVLGMHFLSDVVAGCLTGTVLGYLAYGTIVAT